MVMLSKRFISLVFLITSIVFASSSAVANESGIYYNFNTIPSHQLTEKINLRFITSSKFTVIQWGLKAGAKLPVHSHPNEQVTRVLEGNVEVRTGDHVYHLHAGDVMVFAPYVTHGFTATTDAVMYEQQTPIREDFLQEGFIEKISAYLKQNQ